MSEKNVSENLKLLREINTTLNILKNNIFMINNEIKCIKSYINDSEKQKKISKPENISKGWFFS
tara:strand:- start:92 stop:283 length:192 start_codon:yes stop_codon:yes gene_type:complete